MCLSRKDQFLVHLFLLILRVCHCFIKSFYCCLWAFLKGLISVWISAMKLNPVFSSAGAADELLNLGPSHRCGHAAGRNGWASLAAYTFGLLNLVWPIAKCQSPSDKDVVMCSVMKVRCCASSCRADSWRWISSCCSFKEEKQPRARAQLMQKHEGHIFSLR